MYDMSPIILEYLPFACTMWFLGQTYHGITAWYTEELRVHYSCNTLIRSFHSTPKLTVVSYYAYYGLLWPWLWCFIQYVVDRGALYLLIANQLSKNGWPMLTHWLVNDHLSANVLMFWYINLLLVEGITDLSTKEIHIMHDPFYWPCLM